MVSDANFVFVFELIFRNNRVPDYYSFYVNGLTYFTAVVQFYTTCPCTVVHGPKLLRGKSMKNKK